MNKGSWTTTWNSLSIAASLHMNLSILPALLLGWLILAFFLQKLDKYVPFPERLHATDTQFWYVGETQSYRQCQWHRAELTQSFPTNLNSFENKMLKHYKTITHTLLVKLYLYGVLEMVQTHIPGGCLLISAKSFLPRLLTVSHQGGQIYLSRKQRLENKALQQ